MTAEEKRAYDTLVSGAEQIRLFDEHGITYGYARVSTSRQNLERQIRNILTRFPNAKIYKEYFTGTKMDGRDEFDKLMKRVKPDDTIVFDSVSRMSRNAEEGFKLYKELYARGINLVFIKEPYIDTASYREAMMSIAVPDVVSGDDATDTLINGIMSAIKNFMLNKIEHDIYLAFAQSQKEVDDLRARTREGMLTAKIEGKQIGQRTGAKLVVKKAVKTKNLIEMHSKDFGGTLCDKEIMQLAGVTAKTYYKYKRELRDDI